MSLGAIRHRGPAAKLPAPDDGAPLNLDAWDLDDGDDFCPACDGLAWACVDPVACDATIAAIRDQAGLSP